MIKDMEQLPYEEYTGFFRLRETVIAVHKTLNDMWKEKKKQLFPVSPNKKLSSIK